ncbi:hypothetical protein [Dietzia cinnamea]|nr:hypothetical protein [Dietzia cinnamea]
METIQITYEVPSAIARGLASGELKTLGTAAVRNRTAIAAHIREIGMEVGGQDEALGKLIAKGLKDPRVVVGGISILAVAAVGGGAIRWAANRKRAAAELEVPEPVRRFNTSLGAYVDSIGKGALDAQLISRLLEDLDSFRDHIARGEIADYATADVSEELVAAIADYTSKLAKANSVEVSAIETRNSEPVGAQVLDLRSYLVTQQKIFSGRRELA